MSKHENRDLSPHNLGVTTAYHLLPGMAIVIGYVLIAPFVRRHGLPSAIGISLAVLLVLVPLESGILLWQEKKRNGRFSLGRPR